MHNMSLSSSVLYQVTVGCLCASYWRGAWYCFDSLLFPKDRIKSSVASLLLGSSLLGVNQYILSPAYNGTKTIVRLFPPPRSHSLRAYYKTSNRFINLYLIAMSCVLVWRGAWLMCDEISDQVMNSKSAVPVKTDSASLSAAVSEKAFSQRQNNYTPSSHHTVFRQDKSRMYSGMASHILATIGLLFMGRFNSVMAPPANVSLMKDILLYGKGRELARAARSFTSNKTER